MYLPTDDVLAASNLSSDELKQRRRDKLAAWKEGLQLKLPEAPKKPVVSFSLLGAKKAPETSSKIKIEPLDYSSAEAQVSKAKDDVGADATTMDLDDAGFEDMAKSRLMESRRQSSTTVDLGVNGEDRSTGAANGDQAAQTSVEDDDVDPLEAFMAGIDEEVSHLKQKSMEKALVESKRGGGSAALSSAKAPENVPLASSAGEFELDGEDGEVLGEDEGVDDIAKLAQVNVRKQLDAVDHSKVEYEPFKRDFYVEVPELAKMSEEDVAEFRNSLDGLRVRGKQCPKPIRTFAQSGLSSKILDRLRKMKFEKPTPIQAQALPSVMSGRDVIGIAKTGSGKTLAFLLPLMRHILAQRDLAPGDGPIGLIMVPTRELATQIHDDIKEFRSATGIVSACIYGGGEMSAQIADLKRGAHIVVCTPGRMIEMLTMNKGKLINLRRVTFLVIDEADRMFDLGFEQQIMRIVNNVRPDRQIVMFSATFPRAVEAAARKILSHHPLEITVHGRSVVSDTITQIVEVIDHSQKFYRLMELISEWYAAGSILVFAESQNAVDTLFQNVAKSGYDALSFHAGRDQADRDETIERFKQGSLKILIATSGASRGLDVPGLKLVVNYDVPNHLEDYVHRVGRTGRAGNTGTAVTFIAPDEDKFAGDILKALKQSSCKNIPEQLEKMAAAFEEKQKQGLAQRKRSGFTGKGYQFSEEEEKQHKAALMSTKLHFGGDLAEEALVKDEAEAEESDSEDEGTSRPASVAPTAAAAAVPVVDTLVSEEELAKMPAVQRAAAEKFNELLLAKAKEAAAKVTAAQSVASRVGPLGTERVEPQYFDDEIEINDFPQNVRRKVTSKDTFAELVELTGVAITPKGVYVQPGKAAPAGERKLYLSIEGPSQEAVNQARTGIKQVLEAAMANVLIRGGDRPAGRYQVS